MRPNAPTTVQLIGRAFGRHPVAMAIAYTVLGAAPLFLFSAYAVRIGDELGFGTGELGIAVAAFFLAAAVAASLLGPTVDRLGAPLALLGSALSTSAAALIVAGLATRWQTIAAGLAVAGLANTFAQLGGNRIVAARPRVGLSFAAKQSAVPFGSLAAGLLISTLAPTAAWRSSFIAIAVLGGLAAVVAASLAPDRSDRVASKVSKRARPQLVALAIAGGMGGAAGNALATLLVDALATAGTSESEATRLLAIASALTIASRLALGWSLDVRQSSGYTDLTLLLAAGAVSLATLATAGSNKPVMTLAVVVGFASVWGWPAVIYYVAANNNPAAPATVTGYVLAGVYAGSILGPALVAYVAEQRSYSTAWMVAAAIAAIGAVSAHISRTYWKRSATY